MSRLIGLRVKDANNRCAQMAQPMLDASISSAQWSSRIESCSHVSFGWTGRAASGVSTAHGLLSVLDGRIYNRDEFGETGNDAELLAALTARYGFEAALQRINGDFAAAVYDPGEDDLWLGRDRFGIKPLYYAARPETFAFASRPKALLALPWMVKELNPRFVALFAACHYRYFDNDQHSSPYAGIAQLPAAHFLLLKNGEVRIDSYWSLIEQEDFAESENELAERYRELLLDSVAIRLKVAPRPAFTLSGGMDSSSVLSCASHLTGSRYNAFSTVYADKTFDESEEIRPMVEAKVNKWQPVTVDVPDLFSLVSMMIDAHDEPVATATWLSHFLLCKQAASEHFESLFGGLGGDELNAGEYEYFFYFFADLKREGDAHALAREVDMWIGYHDHPVFRKSHRVMDEMLARVTDPNPSGHCLPDRRRIERYAAALNRDFFDLKTFRPLMDHPFKSYLKNRSYQDIFRETMPCCLRAEDRQCSAYGLENFLPFLDHRLVELMFRVGGQLKIREGVTKHLLRQAMHGILPEETRRRVKKVGWNAPAHVWFCGSGRELLLDLVSSTLFRERGIYNVPMIVKLIDEHEQIVTQGLTKDNHMMFLWQLLNLELWFQKME